MGTGGSLLVADRLARDPLGQLVGLGPAGALGVPGPGLGEPGHPTGQVVARGRGLELDGRAGAAVLARPLAHPDAAVHDHRVALAQRRGHVLGERPPAHDGDVQGVDVGPATSSAVVAPGGGRHPEAADGDARLARRGPHVAGHVAHQRRNRLVHRRSSPWVPPRDRPRRPCGTGPSQGERRGPGLWTASTESGPCGRLRCPRPHDTGRSFGTDLWTTATARTRIR